MVYPFQTQFLLSGPTRFLESIPSPMARLSFWLLLDFAVFTVLTERTIFRLSYTLYKVAHHKVHTYKEYHSVCPSSELGLSQPLSRQRVFPLPPETGGRGHTSLRVGGWGESQFRRGAYTVVLFICTYFVLHTHHNILPTLAFAWLSLYCKKNTAEISCWNTCFMCTHVRGLFLSMWDVLLTTIMYDERGSWIDRLFM